MFPSSMHFCKPVFNSPKFGVMKKRAWGRNLCSVHFEYFHLSVDVLQSNGHRQLDLQGLRENGSIAANV
jgi:hypothetical protein